MAIFLRRVVCVSKLRSQWSRSITAVSPLHGFLVVNKPEGCTSSEIVTRIRRIAGTKTGHGGTLDPNATGVIPIGLGAANRCFTLIDSYPVPDGDTPYKITFDLLPPAKCYEATIRFGLRTSTDDIWGEVLASNSTAAAALTEEAVKAACAKFRGELQQAPPSVSAKRVNGVRAYVLAKQADAEPLDLKPCKVFLYSIELLNFRPPTAALPFPEADVRVETSKGFYVRALARDVGDHLGCGAVASKIHRTLSYPFSIEQAVPLTDIKSVEDIKSHLIPTDKALSNFQSLVIKKEADLRRFAQGEFLVHEKLQISDPLEPNVSPRPLSSSSFYGMGTLFRIYCESLFVGLGRWELDPSMRRSKGKTRINTGILPSINVYAPQFRKEEGSSDPQPTVAFTTSSESGTQES